jgi:hypothetical protein
MQVENEVPLRRESSLGSRISTVKGREARWKREAGSLTSSRTSLTETKRQAREKSPAEDEEEEKMRALASMTATAMLLGSCSCSEADDRSGEGTEGGRRCAGEAEGRAGSRRRTALHAIAAAAKLSPFSLQRLGFM